MLAPCMRYAAVLVSLAVASGAPAQGTSAKPAAPASPKASPTEAAPAKQGDDASAKPAAGYPDAPKKELYATVDLRGKAAPKFHVEKWLTKEPNRKGKTVLIDFWATWCPPCRELIPELNEWQKTYKEDLVVIGVSDEGQSKLEEFMKAHKVEYAIATDTKGAMKSQVGVKGIPHVLLISSDGVVRWQGFPLSEQEPLTEAKLKQVIEADKAARATKKSEPASPDKKSESPDGAPPAKK